MLVLRSNVPDTDASDDGLGAGGDDSDGEMLDALSAMPEALKVMT